MDLLRSLTKKSTDCHMHERTIARAHLRVHTHVRAGAGAHAPLFNPDVKVQTKVTKAEHTHDPGRNSIKSAD